MNQIQSILRFRAIQWTLISFIENLVKDHFDLYHKDSIYIINTFCLEKHIKFANIRFFFFFFQSGTA